MLDLTLGALLQPDGSCRFRLWAPQEQAVELHLLQPEDRRLALQSTGDGYFEATVPAVGVGTTYRFRLGQRDEELADPASRFQPEGVHGPSAVVTRDFPWSDRGWPGVLQEELVFYELHVGTFSAEGTFAGVIPQLEALRDLGVTMIELMPIAQFPGARNWGYDGVFPFAAQDSYGGLAGLRRLVDAAHRVGLGVALDVVYNHLGPEGAVLGRVGPYFTERYHTPWGAAVNFDGPDSDGVRRYFIENALFWLGECHLDLLRLDAVHAILDHSPQTFLEELGEAVHRLGRRQNRRIQLIAETENNDIRLVKPRELGGYGLDGQWNDEYHHILHALLTGEQDGYYADFAELQQLVKAVSQAYVYTGEFSPFRQRRHGVETRGVAAEKFVVFAQNHDQIGNRARGERLGALVPFEASKLAAGLVLLSPYLPLLFMGEEYGEAAPFPYFISHGDPALVEAVRRGRQEEFRRARWAGEVPDPQAEATFASARLDHQRWQRPGPAAQLRDWHRALLQLRRAAPALTASRDERLEVLALELPRLLRIRRFDAGRQDEVVLLALLRDEPAAPSLPFPAGDWELLLDSAAPRFGGPGSDWPARLRSAGELRLPLTPWSFKVLRRVADDAPGAAAPGARR